MGLGTMRRLAMTDAAAVQRICQDSPWIVAQFESAEVPWLLETRPAVGIFADEGGALRAWLLATTFTPPYAWLGGFGVPWQERAAALHLLEALLPYWETTLRAAAIERIIYSGNDDVNDWLRGPLLERGFHHLVDLRAYDKIGTARHEHGNQAITVRPVQIATDLPGLQAIEAATFAPHWRFDDRTFGEMAARYPYFAVAVGPGGDIAGYQTNMIEEELGFLVRIAVHPRYQGQGIGARLMDEAMIFFGDRGIERVLLNAEETNAAAHRLYERWGFELIPPRGFALERVIA